MLGLGVSIIKASMMRIPEWVKTLKSRIADDGGQIEALACAKADVKFLQSLERTTITLDALESYLAINGGEIEAKDCLVDSMEELYRIL